jgi:hypothetical protein
MPLWMPIKRRRAGRQAAAAPATGIPAPPRYDVRAPAGGHPVATTAMTAAAYDGVLADAAPLPTPEGIGA